MVCSFDLISFILQSHVWMNIKAKVCVSFTILLRCISYYDFLLSTTIICNSHIKIRSNDV